MADYKSKKSKNEAGGYQRFLAIQKSKEYGRLYILHGEEKYLLYWCVQALRKKLVDGPASDFNFHRFDSENFSVNAFQDAVESPPMMSEYTMVELVDVNLFDTSYDRSRMAEILQDIPEYCTVAAVYDTAPWKPDKRAKALWGAINGAGEILEFQEQTENELLRWIQKRCSSEGLSIDNNTARYLIQQAGTYMQNLSAELDKLKSYCENGTITRADIDAIVIPVLSAAVYTITEAIGKQDFDTALSMLRNVLSQDIKAVLVSGAIGGQIRQLYVAKLLAENRKSAYDLASLYGMYERKANTIYHQAASFRRPQLKKAIECCAEADLRLKRSSGNDETILVDLLLQLARLQTEQ